MESKHAPHQHLALMLHDGLKFTRQPLTERQMEIVLTALRVIAIDEVDDETPGTVFRDMLDANFTTTAPLTQEFIDALTGKKRQ